MRRALLAGILILASRQVIAQPCPESGKVIQPPLCEGLQSFYQAFGNKWTIGYASDNHAFQSLNGTPAKRLDPDKSMDSIFKKVSLLRGAPLPQFADPVRQVLSGGMTQTRYQQILDGKIVENAFVLITASPLGNLYNIALNQVPSNPPKTAIRSPQNARKVAEIAFYSEVVHEADLRHAKKTTLMDASEAHGSADVHVETSLVSETPSFLAKDRVIRCVFKVIVRATVGGGAAPVTVDAREYSIDAATLAEDPGKAVVRALVLVSHFTAQGRVFDPNPVNTFNNQNIKPGDVKDDDDTAFAVLTSDELSPPVDGRVSLTGNLVSIVQEEGPDPGTPSVPSSAPLFKYKHGTCDFAAAMAYFHID